MREEGQDEAKKTVAERMAQEQEQRAMLSSLLEPEAHGRLSNVAMSNPALYKKTGGFVLALAQSGQLKNRVTDEQMKALLLRFAGSRPKGSIRVMRK